MYISRAEQQPQGFLGNSVEGSCQAYVHENPFQSFVPKKNKTGTRELETFMWRGRFNTTEELIVIIVVQIMINIVKS